MSTAPVVPQKIVLKSTTKMSLNDRFSNISKTRPNVVQTVRTDIAAQQQQSTQKNRRLAQQMANRPTVQAALKLKKRSLQQRLGSNVKSRLTLTPVSPGGPLWRGRGGRGRGRGGGLSLGGGGMAQPEFQGGYMPMQGAFRGPGRGMMTQRGRGGGRGQVAYIPRGRGRGRISTRGYPGTRGRGFIRGGRMRGRGARGMRGGRFMRGAARGRGRGIRGQGRGRGRGAPGDTFSRSQLDNQLDVYMSKTKSSLDHELDSYMAQTE